MADDLERIKKALAADPDSTYGEILPLARDKEGLRFALPGSARNVLQGLVGLMEGAAGETPAGRNLSQKETEALMGLASPSVASRPSPSTLAANWGGKRHERNLQRGLWHGTKGPDSAEDIEKQGFQRGSSAELGIKGTSLSDDPSLSLNRFAESDPQGMLKVTPEGIDASQVFNLRPSAYAAKDYQRALPSQNQDLEGAVSQAEAGAAGESLQSLATKELKERLDSQGMVLEEVGTVNSRITTLDGEVLGEGVSPLSAFVDADKKGAFDNLPAPVRMEAQSLAEKSGQGNLASVDAQAMPAEAANLVLGKSGFQVKPSGNTAFVAYDEDNEPMAMGDSVEEVVNSLAQQDLIQGTDQQRILSAIGAKQTSGAAGQDPGQGAQLIAKPQSYYKESEYFAPQQTGGQSRLKGRRAPLHEVYGEVGREPDLTNFPSDADSAPDQLRDILTTVRESRGPRTQRREAGLELAREARAYSTDELNQAFNETFFPKQHQQMQEIKELATEAVNAQREAQQIINQGRLEAPGAELDAPARKKVDDLFRQHTQALEEMRRRAEKADVPGKSNARAGSRALKTVRDFFSYNTPTTQQFIQNELPENHWFRQLADAGMGEGDSATPRSKMRELTADFVREAGAEYSTPGALQRDLTSYVRDQGVSPLLHAIIGREPGAAVKMLKTVSGRAQLESDDPGSIMD